MLGRIILHIIDLIHKKHKSGCLCRWVVVIQTLKICKNGHLCMHYYAVCKQSDFDCQKLEHKTLRQLRIVGSVINAHGVKSFPSPSL